MPLPAKLLMIPALGFLLGLPAHAFAESSGSHTAAHSHGTGKADSDADICYGQIKKHPYKALLCYEAIDPALKILLKKDADGHAIYENLLKACGHDYVAGVVNAKELGICRKKLVVLDRYERLP